MATEMIFDDTTIREGDHVRSFDFPNHLHLPGAVGERVRACYVDGVVEALEPYNRLPCYVIKIEKSVYEGKPWTYDPPITHVYIPRNGVRLHTGRCARQVVRLNGV